MIDLENEIKKLKYHVSLLGNCIDYEQNPIASLVIEMDWSEADLSAAYDIFEKYSNILDAGKSFCTGDLEKDLRQKFNIGYQKVKYIVLAFYRNHQWVRVCSLYAHDFECVEFHEITRPKEYD